MLKGFTGGPQRSGGGGGGPQAPAGKKRAGGGDRDGVGGFEAEARDGTRDLVRDAKSPDREEQAERADSWELLALAARASAS